MDYDRWLWTGASARTAGIARLRISGSGGRALLRGWSVYVPWQADQDEITTKEPRGRVNAGYPPESTAPEVFVSARRQALSRSGFEYILQKHVSNAVTTCPSLRDKRVSPHVLRHTR